MAKCKNIRCGEIRIAELEADGIKWLRTAQQLERENEQLEAQVAALKADAKFVYDDCWMRADLPADGKVPISYSAWMKICRMAQESEDG